MNHSPHMPGVLALVTNVLPLDTTWAVGSNTHGSSLVHELVGWGTNELLHPRATQGALLVGVAMDTMESFDLM